MVHRVGKLGSPAVNKFAFAHTLRTQRKRSTIDYKRVLICLFIDLFIGLVISSMRDCQLSLAGVSSGLIF